MSQASPLTASSRLSTFARHISSTTTPSADIGVFNLDLRTQDLILNFNDHGFVVCAYTHNSARVGIFLENEGKGTNVIRAESMQDLCAKLKRPRKIMITVRVSSPTIDDFIEQILPYLEPGDIIIDSSNYRFFGTSHILDTIRRTQYLESKGYLFVGAGISGGEERYGPSIMPGGSPAAWEQVKPFFQAIAAKVDGEPCCDWVGENGAGHYVKMIHNGIEYSGMQLIAETYHIMKSSLELTHDEMADVFEEWNKGELDSHLIEITKNILRFRDEDGSPLVEKIRDCAGQKGTGKWTAMDALDRGIPATLVGEAVFARCLSAIKDERIRASKILHGPTARFNGDKKTFIQQLGQALYASRIVSYAQGFMLMDQAAKDYGWQLNNGRIALMWRGGSIIRSAFLGKINEAYTNNPGLENLLFDPFFTDAIARAQDSWRAVIANTVLLGIPAPTLLSALNFYDGFRHESLPANLLQAQRDYFGAHNYERLDNPKTFVHTNWTGRGGNVSSTTYLA